MKDKAGCDEEKSPQKVCSLLPSLFLSPKKCFLKPNLRKLKGFHSGEIPVVGENPLSSFTDCRPSTFVL